MTRSYYPWLTASWSKLDDYRQQNALPNALMVIGEKGLGYQELVETFANSIVCTMLGSNGLACGDCDACRMFAAGSYPDFILVTPEEDESTIKIAAIRKLIKLLSLSRQYDKQRIVVISPVDEMLRQASNSLLKTLEEPHDGTTLILVAHKLANIPATIRSRCQTISSRLSTTGVMLEWLQQQGCEEPKTYLNLANGSPLYAKQLWSNNALTIRNEVFALWLDVVNRKIDPLIFSERCVKLKEYPLSAWIASWLTDAIRLSYDDSRESITNTDLLGNLKLLIKKLHLKTLFVLFDQILEISHFESGQVNKQLLFDEFAIKCVAKN